MYSPHAISKIFSFPGLVLTTAGFILAGVSQTEWSLSRDLSITGCARPHSAANQIGSVLPVLAMGVSWAFSPFRRPMCHYQLPLSSSNVFCRGVVLFSRTNMPTPVCFRNVQNELSSGMVKKHSGLARV